MPRDPDYFRDKTILITGAGSGIGRATALAFAREGSNVVSADIDPEAAERTANQAIQLGARATFVACDVTVRAEVDAAVAQAVSDFGRVDFELNAAGAALARKPFLEITEELWERTYALNVRGHLQRRAGHPAAHAGEGRRRDRQHCERGRQDRRGRQLGPLRLVQGRGAYHDARHRPGICEPGRALPVDLARRRGYALPRQHAARGARRLCRADADRPDGPARGDRRDGAVRLLRAAPAT